ncbi:hypothetical protein [Leptolyngbya sp. NIES-2104]|uniref:hypothetical protein n=1 Tax=Leptolyngbya sp. NIES-2104 TaxID=1552121 RepID=UPI0006EC4C61|nr:hypothetical protein [Leptolyngbya sp. NIES-2104]GAP95912.1 hypothetical protein NIES2104_24390 [Leptolyngbya sp. NIES-2104]
MVQERNLPPRKAQEQDIDSVRRTDPRPIPPVVQNNAGTPVTDIASGLALLLSIIAFFLSCYAAIQASSLRRQAEPASPAPQSNSLNQPESRPSIPWVAQSRFQQVTPGQFRQPTQDETGEVELLSARRVERSGNQNFAKIDLRIRRLDRPAQGLTEIDLPNTIALNSRTNEKYTAVETKTPQDRLISMASLRPGATVNASVIVRVPDDLDRVDLDIPNVRVFRNVPIGLG